jgi:hypothetical protein
MNEAAIRKGGSFFVGGTSHQCSVETWSGRPPDDQNDLEWSGAPLH